MNAFASPPSAGIQALTAVTLEVKEVCALLTSPTPDALERSERVLESAASSLAAWQPDRAGLAAVEQLQSTLRRASRLLEYAFQYHEHWRRRLHSSLAGYEPGGGPAAVMHRGRVYLEG
jgi:hypothetical protein